MFPPSPATVSLCHIFDLVTTNNCLPSKISSVFSCHPSSFTQHPCSKNSSTPPGPLIHWLSRSSLPLDTLIFLLTSIPTADPKVQHCNCLSGLALYSWSLSLQHILSLVKSNSACTTPAPKSWMCLGKKHTVIPTGLTSFLPSVWPASLHFPTFPKSETTIS